MKLTSIRVEGELGEAWIRCSTGSVGVFAFYVTDHAGKIEWRGHIMPSEDAKTAAMKIASRIGERDVAGLETLIRTMRIGQGVEA